MALLKFSRLEKRRRTRDGDDGVLDSRNLCIDASSQNDEARVSTVFVLGCQNSHCLVTAVQYGISVLFVQCHQVILLHAFSFFPVVNGVVRRVLYRGMSGPCMGESTRCSSVIIISSSPSLNLLYSPNTLIYGVKGVV
jgi:hypothetical protein